MRIGLEIEVEDVTYRPSSIPGVHVETDGSLRNGLEFITEPLPDTTFANHVYTYLYHNIKGTYSERCGFHFHMDFTGKSTDTIIDFLSRYLELERTLFRLYPHLFRSNNNFCNLLTESPAELRIIRDLANGSTSSLQDFSKYSALNIKPLTSLQTIEFRAAPAGLSPENVETILSIFENIYNDTVPETLTSQITAIDKAEAEAIIQLIRTPYDDTSTSDLGEYMSTHFDVPTTVTTTIPTADNIREFLRSL